MHSRSTEYFNLPQFDANDKPTYLGDINGAFLAIDAALHTSTTDSADALTAAQRATESLNAALTRATRALELSESANTAAELAHTESGNALTVANNTATLAQELNAKIDAAKRVRLWLNPLPSTAWGGGTMTLEVPESVGANYDILIAFNSGEMILFPRGGGDGAARAVDADRTTGATVIHERTATTSAVSGGVALYMSQCNEYRTSGGSVDTSVDNSALVPRAVYAVPFGVI